LLSHHFRSEWWLYVALLQLLPVQLAEKWMLAYLVLIASATQSLFRILGEKTWENVTKKSYKSIDDCLS